MKRENRRERGMGRFPVFGFLILIFATLWLLREINVIDLRVPFLPILLIVISIGIIFNRLIRK